MPNAFTLKYDHLASEFIFEVQLTPANNLTGDRAEMPAGALKVGALIDTGAAVSCITPRAARTLGLTPIGQRPLMQRGFLALSNAYLIDIYLPGNVVIPSVPVLEMETNQNFDVILGMDFLSIGDMALSHFEGKSVFSFRIPTTGVVDFVELTKLEATWA